MLPLARAPRRNGFVHPQVHMSAGFWFIAGVLAGVTATAVGLPLWRASAGAVGRVPLRYTIATGAVATFAASALLIYLAIGSPRALERSTAAAPTAHPGADQPPSGAKVQSMEAAAAGLEARLAREGGNANDWLLLAQSYDFLGRPDDAKRARARAADAGASSSRSAPTASNASMNTAMQSPLPLQLLHPVASTPAVASSSGATSSSGAPTSGATPEISAGELERQLSKNPRDAKSWLALANLHRSRREYDAARAAFVKVAGLNAMTAEAWADYADVLGSLDGGSLGGEAGRAIEHALALDPRNVKALWLEASRAHEERRYPDALADWRSLKAVLPPDSPDVRIIDENIAEATQLAAAAPTQPVDRKAPGTVGTEISGTVSIEGRLAARLVKDATLFIYAKAADSPGPPLAVMRTTATTWPVSFHLDDSMAMVPSRRLSQFQKVVIEARISRTGQALPAPGDFYVTSEVLSPSAGKKLALIINREIG
jgi:cytochrome c-type biogenesis protein CcmH